MTLLAVNAAAGIRTNRDYAPHSVKQVFFHTQQGLTNVLENSRTQNPTAVIDITPVIHKKFKAMNKCTSQYYGEDGPLLRKLSEIADGSQHAIHAKVPYAEPFIAYRPDVYKSLPLSDYTLELAQKSEPEHYEYLTQILLDPEITAG